MAVFGRLSDRFHQMGVLSLCHELYHGTRRVYCCTTISINMQMCDANDHGHGLCSSLTGEKREKSEPCTSNPQISDMWGKPGRLQLLLVRKARSEVICRRPMWKRLRLLINQRVRLQPARSPMLGRERERGRESIFEDQF